MRKYSKESAYEFSTQEHGIVVPDVDDKSELDIWPTLLSKWEQLQFTDRYRTVLGSAVRKGIPFAIRGEAWKILSGGNELQKKNPGVYEILVTKESASESCLKKDISRTYPLNKTFRLAAGQGQTAMYNVLKVYSIMDPEVGYCQGMSFICGLLIHHNLSEVDAFWCLSAMMRGFNIRGFFLDNLPLLNHFVYRFTCLLQSEIPSLSKHFQSHSVDPLYFCAEWFNTIFSYSIPMETAARIWDVFFFSGIDYLLCVALAILKQSEDELLASPSFDVIIQLLKQKTSVLEVSIIEVAAKFEYIYKQLPSIDISYAAERERRSNNNTNTSGSQMAS